MIRLRCSVGSSFITFQREALVSRHGRVAFRPVGYGLSIATRLFHTEALKRVVPHSRSGFVASSSVSAFETQRRWVRARRSEDQQQQQQQQGENEQQKGDSGENASSEKSEKQQQKKPSGFRAHIEGLKEDYVRFPDIYNSANALNFVLFTVFCLCSTGSNVEEKWWLDNWGIDATFSPLAWPLHSLLMNNFLSMTFAMMLLHTMCHSVLPTIGSRGLLIYCAATAVMSGFILWAGNYMANNTSEKQFGPWDIVAALFVMQYLHQGFTPFQILNSFNGWVRYACWVGAVCILYFDWQPTVVGTLMGIALCKGHPKFRVTSTAV